MPHNRYHPLEIETKRETALKLIESMAVANLTQAADAVGVPDSTLQMWRDASPEFRRRWDSAMLAAKRRTFDRVESVMVERALDPKNPVGVTAGIFLLKSQRAVYADKPQASNSITVHIDKAQINLAGQTVDEMRKLEDPTS